MSFEKWKTLLDNIGLGNRPAVKTAAASYPGSGKQSAYYIPPPPDIAAEQARTMQRITDIHLLIYGDSAEHRALKAAQTESVSRFIPEAIERLHLYSSELGGNNVKMVYAGHNTFVRVETTVDATGAEAEEKQPLTALGALRQLSKASQGQLDHKFLGIDHRHAHPETTPEQAQASVRRLHRALQMLKTVASEDREWLTATAGQLLDRAAKNEHFYAALTARTYPANSVHNHLAAFGRSEEQAYSTLSGRMLDPADAAIVRQGLRWQHQVPANPVEPLIRPQRPDGELQAFDAFVSVWNVSAGWDLSPSAREARVIQEVAQICARQSGQENTPAITTEVLAGLTRSGVEVSQAAYPPAYRDYVQATTARLIVPLPVAGPPKAKRSGPPMVK